MAEKRRTGIKIPRAVTPAKAGGKGDSQTLALVDSRLRGNDASLTSARLWVAAERLPQFMALWPDARLDPPIAAPASHAERAWAPEEALVEILRRRLEGLGPVTEAALAAPLGLSPDRIPAALMTLRGQGFAMPA